MKKIIFFCLCILLYSLKSEEIMWWIVDETATVDGDEILTFLQSYPEDDNHWSAVRIKATVDGQIKYLDIESPGFGRIDGTEGAWIGDSGDGYGISTGRWANQSPLDGFSREIWESAMFQAELGYLTYDDVLDVTDWVTLAQTDPVAKSLLVGHLYERGSIMPMDYTQWTPTDFYTPIPEPKSCLLILIGISVLSLKRSQKWKNRKQYLI